MEDYNCSDVSEEIEKEIDLPDLPEKYPMDGFLKYEKATRHL